jgi:hypothetical protein
VVSLILIENPSAYEVIVADFPYVRSVNLLRRSLSFALAATLVSGCGGGGGGGGPVTPPGGGATPTPPPSSAEALYQCPTSDTPSSSARSAAGLSRGFARRVAVGGASATTIPGRLVVTYDRGSFSSGRTAFLARETAAGAKALAEYDLPHTSRVMRILSVPPAQASAITATLRAEPGVKSVGATGGTRAPLAVTTPYFTNDPYFTGFPTSVTAGASSSTGTFEVGPYEENQVVPGQWNEHVIGLEDAFAYSQPNNGSSAVNVGAVGSPAVKIAIIDTGEDINHPELATKIAYQKCFLTDPNGVQSTSSHTLDEVGHGTDVSGIAGAATNNAFGFASSGGASVIYAYRVQPTPDANCYKASTDPVCNVQTEDIASAILDAIAQNVNVISVSLGVSNDPCTDGGVDPDAVEGNAIAEALAANIVVVASSGNDGKAIVSPPACDSGVIAAGATALADGQPNGSGSSAGSAAAPFEYVASYSNYGSTGASFRNPNAWGIVAPGGDPKNGMDLDYLHWVTDIWTTTPLSTTPADVNNYSGDCTSDYPGTGSQADCKVLIAGTSMSAPEIAGAAAILIAANGTYQSPSKMKTLLCSTADDIGDGREGCGRLNVYRAMAVAVGDTSPP